MVREQIEARGLSDARVLDAMRTVPRHLFVPESRRRSAHEDAPLPIDCCQTISQPYIVALMSSLAALKGDETVLDIGTGSGYQAAVLSLLAHRVVSVERFAPLAESAKGRLADLGYANVEVHVADGSCGWPTSAPYDAAIVAAGAQSVPTPLTDQLAPGGRLVIPVGGAAVQTLTVATRHADGRVTLATHGSVVFVPLIGRYGWPE